MEASLRVQERINKLIQDNQVYRKWDKKMVVHCEQYCIKENQHVPASALIDTCEINVYFQDISNDPNYTAP